ncbi:hypothetical protein CBL_10221 [Carabus blaptoides fortunei]
MFSLSTHCSVCHNEGTKQEAMFKVTKKDEQVLNKLIACSFEIDWLDSATIISICNACYIRLQIANDFIEMCHKNCAVLKGYVVQLNHTTDTRKDNKNGAESESDSEVILVKEETMNQRISEKNKESETINKELSVNLQNENEPLLKNNLPYKENEQFVNKLASCSYDITWIPTNTNNLKEIDIPDIDNIKIVRKLEYCTSKCKNIRPAIPLYICAKCCQDLRTAYEFKKSYYRSCKLLKGYVSQLKRNKSCYNYAGKKLQQELQVKLTNLGECMIDGQVSRDLVHIENVETQFVNIVPESETRQIVTNITTKDSIMVNNLVEENISLEFNNNDHLDIDEMKISDVKSEETIEAITVDNADMNILEEKQDMCQILVENQNGNTFINFPSSVMQQSIEIIQDINVLDTEESHHKSQLNLVLEGIAKSEDTGDVCKIWVENTSNMRLNNTTDTVSSITVNESARIKQEIPENTNHNCLEITDTISSSIVNERTDIKEEYRVPDNVQKENTHVKHKEQYDKM